MELVVETGSGLATSNAYCTIDEADEYHEERLHNEAWINETSLETKEKALVWATRVLDEEVEWKGVIYASGQALRWPRYGVYTRDGVEIGQNVIPTWLKNATAELAMYLIESDRTTDSGSLGYSNIKVGPIELDIDKQWQSNVLPKSVWNMIKYYGAKVSSRKQLVRA